MREKCFRPPVQVVFDCMVLIPSCIAKVCKQSYHYNSVVKVHVCVGVALLKRKMIEPAKLQCITEIVWWHGVFPNIITQPYVAISSFKALFKLYLVKNNQWIFFSWEGEEGCQFKGLITAFYIKTTWDNPPICCLYVISFKINPTFTLDESLNDMFFFHY